MELFEFGSYRFKILFIFSSGGIFVESFVSQFCTYDEHVSEIILNFGQ